MIGIPCCSLGSVSRRNHTRAIPGASAGICASDIGSEPGGAQARSTSKQKQRHRRKEMVSPDDHDLLPDGRLGAGSISRRPRNTIAPHCIKYNAWRAVRAALVYL